MTTAADVIRVAEEVRAAGLIYREPRGWGGYVSIQQQPPYDAASGNDRFGRDRVDHCGIGVAFVLTRAGLQFGLDYPDGIQLSSLLARQLLYDGWHQGEPRPGDIGVIDWEGNGWGATGASDHVVLIMEVRGDTLITWECNTTPDGGAYYYERHRSQFTAWGTPRYAPPKPDHAPVVATITALQAMKAQEDTMPLLIDLTDESGAVVGHRAYLPGLGWREPSTAELTEDNGWTRASLPAAEMEAWALQSLGDVATMTDLTARRVKAIMDEA